MAIVTENITINGKHLVRTYSDAGRYVVGGNPHGNYEEAVDPVELGRTYVEGDLLPDEEDVPMDEALRILLGGDAE